jgi:hypothetical protein
VMREPDLLPLGMAWGGANELLEGVGLELAPELSPPLCECFEHRLCLITEDALQARYSAASEPPVV